MDLLIRSSTCPDIPSAFPTSRIADRALKVLIVATIPVCSGP